MPQFKLPPLYPIANLDSHKRPQDFIEDILSNEMCSILQIRAKDLPDEDFLELAKWAIAVRDKITSPSNRKLYLIINDRIKICQAAGADGVHLGQADIAPHIARSILGENAIIGFSTHNIEQVNAANSLPVNYLGYGPIFQTYSKANPDPTVGIEGLTKAIKQSLFPIVAIGGISLENVKEVYKTGVSSVAVIRDLIEIEDVNARVSAFHSEFKLAATEL